MSFIARVGWAAVVLVLAGCGGTTIESNPGATGGAQSTSASGYGGVASAGASSASSNSGSAGAPTTLDPPANGLGTGGLGLCNAEGWCWQNPAPVGDLFNAISDDGRYAAGENGVVVRWPDRYLPRAGEQTLFFVQAAGDAVWAGGSGLWRFDGSAWIQESGDQVDALSLTPSGEPWVWLNGGLQHLHDGEWRREQPAGLVERALRFCDLIAVDEDTVWVLATNFVSPKGMPDGGQLTLFEFHAGIWSDHAAVTDAGGSWRFLRVDSKIYVATENGYQGVYSPAEDWSSVAPEPLPAIAWYGVFASPTGGLLATEADGLYTVSDRAHEKVSSARCSRLVPTSDEAALCANLDGGLSLVRLAKPAKAAPVPQQLAAARFGRVPTPVWAQAYAAWGSGPTDVWRDQLEHFDGVKWESHLEVAPEDFRVEQIDGSAPDNVWFRSYRDVLRFDGSAFHWVPLPDEGNVFVSAIHTLAANDTWMVRGDQQRMKVLHFDGAEWHETLDLVGDTYAYDRAGLAGGGTQPLWAALGYGLYRWQANAWQVVAKNDDGYALLDVAADGGDVWVLGQDAVHRLEGSELVPLGRYSGSLQNIALTEGLVWHFWGSHARTLAR